MITSAPRRVLVDECVPRQLLRALGDLNPRTVRQAGWAGYRNGRLLDIASEQFDVLFTVDKGFAGLGNAVPFPIGVVILELGNSTVEDLLPYVDSVRVAIDSVKAGMVLRIGSARVREVTPTWLTVEIGAA